MQVEDASHLLLSATDLSNHLCCPHLTSLNLGHALGGLQRPYYKDPTLEALWKRGLDHEAGYIGHLEATGRSVARIPTPPGSGTAVALTLQALRAGADVIAQAALQSGRWQGRADVLLKVAAPSALGPWSYEVHDTKLARETKGGALLQICLYSEVLAEVQGTRPEHMAIVRTGTAFTPDVYRIDDYAAYYRYVKDRLESAVADPDSDPITYPEPCAHCDICAWRTVCDKKRRDDDHLSLVAGISRLQRRELDDHGITTLESLAEWQVPKGFRPSRGSADSFHRVREQARVQLEYRMSGERVHELLDAAPERGLARLPEPSSGDVFLDLEGDPFIGEGGREYLFGYVTLNEVNELNYTDLWAFTSEDEKRAFEQLLDDLTARGERFPDMHVYHYAPYEPGALKRLMGRYATRENELDVLLRAGRFVDLYGVVRQGVRCSVEKYSIKDLEPFYGFERETDLHEANRQRHALQCALEVEDPSVIDEDMRNVVLSYNRDDCISTFHLRNWLEELRGRLIGQGHDVPRPAPRVGEPSEALSERQEEIRALMTQLTQGVPADPEARRGGEQARWVLAQILEFYRREDKASWWEYFRLRDLPPEDLLDERAALAGLTLLDDSGRIKRSALHRYGFPAQETDIRADADLHAPELEVFRDGFGTVIEIDTASSTLDVKKRGATESLHPDSVFVHTVFGKHAQQDSLMALAEWVAENGIVSEDPTWRAARHLLLGHPPQLSAGTLQAGVESDLDRAKRAGTALDNSVLPVQGPPGSGKTYTGARMIVELVRDGKKVGVTAVSHKVIRNFLKEVVSAAGQAGVELKCIEKVTEIDDENVAGIKQTKDNADIVDALTAGEAQVGAGTSWLWAREDCGGLLDVLFIDEAGQMSLTDALAVARSTKSLVLLGDPQQLEQPMQGSHPDGTDVSALQHVLGDLRTIPDDRGLFLGETWRLHPNICSFTSELFYDSRLGSHAGLEQQDISGGSLSGTGLRFVPIEHSGNVNASPEEAHRIAGLVTELTAGAYQWRDGDCIDRLITRNDILIVAPYNAQVATIAERIPGARVGTVDRFQGQEAPVVVYSMTTSLPEDAPRGMEFLYSLNRLNVATSRARCAVFLVASPRLLEVDCHSPRQMKLANAFCRYVEMAKRIQ